MEKLVSFTYSSFSRRMLVLTAIAAGKGGESEE